MRHYPVQHLQGHISFENVEVFREILEKGFHDGDIGVQIAADGRVWICIDGVAFIRASSHRNRKMSPD